MLRRLDSRTHTFTSEFQDSLVSAKTHLPTIERIHAALPKITAAGERLQMIVCSATLHNFDVKKLAVSFFCLIHVYSCIKQSNYE